MGVFVPAAFLAATSGAVVQSPTGDTCTAAGNGKTAYTLEITIPGNAPQQGGFAFGAPGARVTNINVAATKGTFSTTSLPANTTGEWLPANPAAPGTSIIASLTTNGPVTGSFTVTAANSPPKTFFDPFVCPLATGHVPSNAFTAEQHFTYDSVTGTWHDFVTVPGPGKLIFNQVFKHQQTPAASKPLIQSGVVSVKGVGKVKLTLKPAAAGKTALKATGSIKLNLSIEFSPKNGKPASKVLSLTLKK
jgi:hypothetical protein